MRRVVVALWLAVAPSVRAAEPDATSGAATTAFQLEPAPVRERAANDGFDAGAQSFSLLAGAGPGFTAFGGSLSHNLALMSLSYGRMLGNAMGPPGSWYRGNWEFRVELFGGAEFSPDQEWIIGLTPHLRYNFATGTRWIPFIDGGAGVSATGIGPPDLSGTFEFNLQPGVGMHCLLSKNLAVTAEARYMHVSCAGISHPNAGLNTVLGLIGVTWFF